MRTVFLCGHQPSHFALGARLAEQTDLRGTVVVGGPPQALLSTIWHATRREPLRLYTRAAAALPLRLAWDATQAHYAKAADFPANALVVPSINDAATLELIEQERPELIVVSGTDLLRRPLIEAASRHARIMNLHTGISPWIKGAPNCANWCLATQQFGLIGNSTMWIDAGIDTGALLATERTALTGKESLKQIHRAVMAHAHDLALRTVARIGSARDFAAIPQNSVGRGKLYLKRDWSTRWAARAVINHALQYAPDSLMFDDRATPLVSLDMTFAR